MESVRKFAADGRAGAGHLQRISNPVRSRTAARSIVAQCGSEVCLQAGTHSGREHQHAVHTAATKGEVLEIPIGHMEGNYFCDEPTLAELKDQDRIVFRYIDACGRNYRRRQSQRIAGEHCRDLQ